MRFASGLRLKLKTRFEFAESSPYPDPETVEEGIYAP